MQIHNIIETISDIHGEYPGSVNVSFRNGEGEFETKRVHLSSDIINSDGSYNFDQVQKEVEQAILGDQGRS